MAKTSSKYGFWGKLNRPIYAMAPMVDVTDAAYRFIIAKYGKPDVLFTEFTSVDGLCSRGLDNLAKNLLYDEIERPICVQLFGNNPENFLKAAAIAKKYGFDGIDINMGCPVKDVVKTGSGAALINSPDLAKKIISATKEGSDGLPVSVKTRIGFNSITIEEWMTHLLDASPAAVTLHLRTKKEMSLAEAHWDTIEVAVNLAKNTDTLILANGDLKDLAHADDMIQQTGVDGVMLARAIYGYPWLFDRNRTKESITVSERLDIMVEHSEYYEKIFEAKKHFAVMIKHLRAYASGFDGAKELRVMMESVTCSDDVKNKISDFLANRQITQSVIL